MSGCQSEFATELRTPQTGIPCSGRPISRQPESTAVLQLLFDQLFTRPADQPRHATLIDDDPVKSDRPRFSGVHKQPAQAIARRPSSVTILHGCRPIGQNSVPFCGRLAVQCWQNPWLATGTRMGLRSTILCPQQINACDRGLRLLFAQTRVALRAAVRVVEPAARKAICIS